MVTAPDIPGHRVSGVLGAGGFATVYRCWQLAVGREVAVKVDNRVLLTERDRRRFLPHGSGPPAAAARTRTGSPAQGGGAAADAFGIRTKSSGCPATLRVAPARCPASPECFAGIVTSAGSSTASIPGL